MRASTRVKVGIYALAAYFAAVAVTAIVLGLHDGALTQPGLGVLAGSVFLVVVGVVQLLAVYELVALNRSWKIGDRPACEWPVIAALLLTILLCFYVLLSALRTPSSQRPVVTTVVLALGLVALVGLRVFAREVRRTFIQIGTVALALVGTSVGVWEFWYQSQYVPSHVGHEVTLRVGLERTGQHGAYDVIRASVTYENVGGRSVAVLGSTYTLTGSQLVRCVRHATAKAVGNMFNGFLVDPQRVRYMAGVWEIQPATILAAGKFVGDGKRLDGNVSSSRNFTFFVRRHAYELLRLRAQLYAIPASVRLSQRVAPVYKRYPGDNDLYGFWRVDDESWLHQLVSGRRRLVLVQYELVRTARASQAMPDLRVVARFPRPTWREKMPSEEQVHKLFGRAQPTDASEPFGDSELGLGAPVKPTEKASCPKV